MKEKDHITITFFVPQTGPYDGGRVKMHIDGLKLTDISYSKWIRFRDQTPKKWLSDVFEHDEETQYVYRIGGKK